MGLIHTHHTIHTHAHKRTNKQTNKHTNDSHVPVRSLRPAPRLATRPGLPIGATPAEERGPTDGGPMRVYHNHIHINKAGFVQKISTVALAFESARPSLCTGMSVSPLAI